MSIRKESSKLKVSIFADGADLGQISKLIQDSRIDGFTTNPTLMRKAGVKDYLEFARKALEIIEGKPISFEVIGDEKDEMRRQALILSKLGINVYVKIPVINSRGESSIPIVSEMISLGIPVNITAIFTKGQIEESLSVFSKQSKGFLSIFSGRIADSGVDPEPTVKHAVDLTKDFLDCKVIWASPREILNYIQAERSNCHIITMTSELIEKLNGLGKNLEDVCRDTVTMFRNDSLASDFRI